MQRSKQFHLHIGGLLDYWTDVEIALLTASVVAAAVFVDSDSHSMT